MSALVKNGDLVPDAAGMITKQQTLDALVNTGISRKVAKETTDANFDHLDDKKLNVFRMNTVKPPGRGTTDPPGPLEHFRSTGIRDGFRPNTGRYVHFHNCAHFDGNADTFSTRDIRECANLVWDRETCCDFSSLPAKLHTNDVLESKRPSTCGPTDSGPEQCPSQLHGAINFLHEEFGTPTGESALMTVTDMERLWLEAEYPAEFLARSPRSCLNATDLTAAGCQHCLDEVPSTGPGGFPVTAATSTEAQRYCRCLASRNLTTHQLDAIAAHGNLRCPRDPVVEANITVASVAGRQRALQQGTGQETYADALRGIIRGFYASLRPHLRVLEYNEADVLIRPLSDEDNESEAMYSVRLAAPKEDAPYLAYAVRVELLNYVSETTTALQIIAITVDDDIRLESDCGQFCEASGSFLSGFIPQKPSPPPAPPTAPGDACLNPCLQSTCSEVRTFGTCSQIADMGCWCDGCCTDVLPPPSPAPTVPPPPTPSQSFTFVVNLVLVVSASIDSFDARDFAQRIASLLDGVRPEDITLGVVAGSVRVEAHIPTPTNEAAESVVYALQKLADSSAYASEALMMNITSVQRPETSRLEPPLPPLRPATPPLPPTPGPPPMTPLGVSLLYAPAWAVPPPPPHRTPQPLLPPLPTQPSPPPTPPPSPPFAQAGAPQAPPPPPCTPPPCPPPPPPFPPLPAPPDVSLEPSHIYVGEPTSIAVGGSAAGYGDTLVFLPAGTADCTGAAQKQYAQGGRVSEALSLNVTLSTEAVYKLCRSSHSSPTLDAQFRFVSSAHLVVHAAPNPSPPSPPPAGPRLLPPPPSPPPPSQLPSAPLNTSQQPKSQVASRSSSDDEGGFWWRALLLIMLALLIMAALLIILACIVLCVFPDFRRTQASNQRQQTETGEQANGVINGEEPAAHATAVAHEISKLESIMRALNLSPVSGRFKAWEMGKTCVRVSPEIVRDNVEFSEIEAT